MDFIDATLGGSSGNQTQDHLLSTPNKVVLTATPLKHLTIEQ